MICLARGDRDRDIARALGKDEDTIKNMLRALRKKNGLRKRLDMALWARDQLCPRPRLTHPNGFICVEAHLNGRVAASVVVGADPSTFGIASELLQRSLSNGGDQAVIKTRPMAGIA